jgi:yersiniabactin nonribosomal peptide synthetase
MPVVFTSALGISSEEGGAQLGEILNAATALSSEDNFGITQSSQVWIDHVVRESQGALGVVWDSLEELFPAGMLDAMFDSYTKLLKSFSTEDIKLEHSIAVDLPDTQGIVRDNVNNTSTVISELFLDELFRRKADQFPTNIAIKNNDIVITYKQLDIACKNLADHLFAHNPDRSRPVAIIMDKGWEQIVAALSILYSGGIYLPIDAGLPIERIKTIIEKSSARHVITQPSHSEKLSRLKGLIR